MSSPYVVGDQPVPGAGYRLAAFLGRGGFGEVWKATAPGGAEAALKIIRLGSREGSKELRALQLVKRIHHTHLVPIIAFWIKNDKGEILDDSAVLQAEQPKAVSRVTAAPDAFIGSSAPTAATERPTELIIAMGLGERSLYDRLEQCRSDGLPGIPDDELLGYLEDSAGAIDFLNSPLHDLGSGPVAIQHCDIKPHNLVIVGGSVQVCDFGLARMMGADRATTAAASVAYAAPECLVEGKPSATTDQYCLAISFIELKTGQLPYGELTMAAVMDAKRNNNLDYSMLPEAVRPVVRRATSSDPAKRYGSCREMVRELRRALAPPEAAAKARASKHLRRLLAAALGLAALAAGGVWALNKYTTKQESILTPSKPPAAQADATSSGKAFASTATKPVEPPVVQHPNTNQADMSKREGEALLERGFAALKNKEFAAAVTDLERASKLLPRDARVFSRLGAAWFAQEKWDQAIASYTTAIEIEPYDNDFLNRGRAYLETKSADEAVKDFAAAVRMNPGNAAAYVMLGNAYVDKDDAEQAITAFSAAVRICASDSHANFPQLTARLLRANVYISTGRKAEAADDLTKALPLLRDDPRSIPSVVEAQQALAAKYAEAGQYDDAVKWAEKSVELAPDEESKRPCRESLKEYQEKQLAARGKHASP